MIGESGFASVAHPGNLVRVSDGLEGGEPGMREDWTTVYVVPGGRLKELSLTFYDSAGRAINGQTLPGSAAALSAFPDLVLYAEGAIAGFGQYSLNVAITQVPEPSVMVLGLVGLALLGTLRQGRRSAAGLGRSRAEPGAARNDGPATAS